MTTVIPVDFEYISSNFTDENYEIWDSTKEYQTGDFVIFQNQIYKCATSGISSVSPNLDIYKWVNFGFMNSRRFMDNQVSTISTNKNDTQIVIKTEKEIDTIALFKLDGAFVEIYDKNGKLLTEKINLTYKNSRSWWQYFFGEWTYKHDAIIKLDKPYKGEITIKIYKGKFGANLGHLVLGNRFFIGVSIYGAKIGIVDYSKITSDEFGNKNFSKGKNAKFTDILVVVGSERVDTVREELEKLAGRVALFIGDEREYGYQSLMIFGYYKDFSILLDNYKTSECQISIEGVI